MSIFKETLENSIQTQLQARTLVVSGENGRRNNLLPWYLSKNSWVRMTSFVNYTSGNQLKPDDSGSLIVIPDGSYKDTQLSKKYILEGGTLYTKTNGSGLDGILRYGVSTPQAAYGGNIDVRPNNTADPEYFRTFGIRPMPGITEMSLRTIGAYGSLFETTVKFYAWDINQLNELEILFMRPGYSVLLEWGWSQYIDYATGSVQNFTPSNRRNSNLTQDDIYPTVFNGITINPFENLSQDDVYLQLEALRKEYRHNYDGMLGYVKNFTWTMMTNGGFECQTTLISMGEAINTVKMSSNVNRGSAFTIDPKAASNYAYDDYENILLSLKADVDSKYYQYLNNNTGDTALLENEYRGNWNYNSNYISRDIIKNIVSEYYPNQATKIDEAPQLQEVEFKEPSETGRYYEYLTLDVWLAIVASYFNIKSNSKKDEKGSVPLVKFQLPGDDDLCLACKDSISVTPFICQVKNNGAFKAEIAFMSTNNGGMYSPSINGINPPMYQFENDQRKTLNNITYQFYDDTLKAGKIKNIFVNISMLLQTYKDMKNASNDEGVIMLDYIKNVLNKISNSLGGLNNFGLSTVGKTQNVMKVVDFYYLESGFNSKADQKYQFDLLGLGSICRNVNIQSQIFENQSTIVAIAAQSRANLADVYNSSQVYLNAGLEDRIALNKWQGDELDNIKANKDDVFYQKLYSFMLYARDYIVGNLIPNRTKNDYRIKVETSGQANPSTILKQSMLRYNSELNFKALIPFKLRITIDGIGGIVVGQIFTVKQNVLPKNYYDKQLGFVITQINHKLTKNDWETELETQICILDQDRPLLQNFINIKRDGFGLYVAVQQTKSILYPILQDFLIYQATRSIIGYIYASIESYSTQTGGGAKFVYEYLYKKFNKDNDAQQFWIDNQPEFIGLGTGLTSIAPTPGTNKSYQMYEFEAFVIDWMKTWTNQQPASVLSETFSRTKTLQDLSDFIINKNYISNTVDDEYNGFNDVLEEIQFYLNKLNPEFFYPIANAASIYYDPSQNKLLLNGEENSILNFSFGPNGGLFFVNGWNVKNLINRIYSITTTNQTIRNLANFYNSNTAIANTKPLNNYFSSCSDVMYGKPNSLIINEKIVNNGTVLGNFGFGNDGTNSQFLELKKIDETFANTIYWNQTFNRGIKIRTNPGSQTTSKIVNLPNVFYEAGLTR